MDGCEVLDGPASGEKGSKGRLDARPASLKWPVGAYILSYRGTSLIRNSPSLGPYSRTMPRALWWSLGGGLFL